MAIVDQTGMRLRTALEAELAVTLHWCDLTSLVVVDNPSLCHMAGAQQMQQLKHARSCARIRSRIKNTTLPSRPNANSIASAHYVVAMHAYIPVVGVVQPTGNTRCSFVQQKKNAGPQPDTSHRPLRKPDNQNTISTISNSFFFF
jgi:hypothetical protein